MANEITLDCKVKYAKSSTTVDLGVLGLSIDVTGSQFIHNRQSIGTSEEAIALGEVAAGGYFVAVNRDATNFVSIRQATGASDLVRINAGEAACFRLDADATAPFAIADTAACELEYLLVVA